MAALAVQIISRSGLVPTMVAAGAGGDTFPNSGNTALMVLNSSAAPINVTIVTTKTVDGLAVADRVVAVPNGTTPALIGPWPKDEYNTSGSVSVTYSASASVTVAAVSLTPVS